MLTLERLNEIMETEYPDPKPVTSDFDGLVIFRKYTENVISGAEHDELYGPDAGKIIKAGLTEEDAVQLSKLGWFIDDDSECFCHFV